MREIVCQARHVAADVPLFLSAPLYRSRHLAWGATSGEVASAMPGDDLLPTAQYRTTRAITIAAPPSAVWPWLVQVGCGRAGFHSNDLLDNLARPSSRVVVPDRRHLEVGQWVSMSPGEPSETTAFRVDTWSVEEWLLWRKPDSTWAWRLDDLGAGRTRLVTRVRAVHDWSHPALAVVGVLLLELGDFAMMRRMLMGIRERAEALASVPA